MSSSPLAYVADRPPLVRRRDERMVAGVSEAVARHLMVGALPVRVGFVVLTAFGGAGAVAYAALWMFMAQDATPVTPVRRTREWGPSVALIVLGLGVALFVGLSTGSGVVLAVVLGGAGVALVWRQVDEGRLPRSPEGWALLGAGGVLLLSALVVFLVASNQVRVAGQAFTIIVVVVVGLVLLTTPWWRRLAGELRAERRERIRTQERAEVAAHLHDSVLQTLALIQRHVESPREVARLARGQERELRGWLYGHTAQPDLRLAAAVEAVAAEVEDGYAVAVETVVVGDCALDDGTRALVQATREALVNAARHAGVETVSLYAEVDPDQVVAYVRDRGVGFDSTAVPSDRHGLRGSIEHRMTRHGGRSVVRSAVGAGTEIELSVPLAAARR